METACGVLLDDERQRASAAFGGGSGVLEKSRRSAYSPSLVDG